MFVLKIQESAENYLETIYMLSRHKPYVRSIDIANELSFSKPSVSVAMKNLRENGYIRMDEQGHITLTETGQSIADVMYERHILLSNWLIYLMAVLGSSSIGYRLMRNIQRAPGSRVGKYTMTGVMYLVMFALSLAFLVTQSFNPFLYFRF